MMTTISGAHARPARLDAGAASTHEALMKAAKSLAAEVASKANAARKEISFRQCRRKLGRVDDDDFRAGDALPRPRDAAISRCLLMLMIDSRRCRYGLFSPVYRRHRKQRGAAALSAIMIDDIEYSAAGLSA